MPVLLFFLYHIYYNLYKRQNAFKRPYSEGIMVITLSGNGKQQMTSEGSNSTDSRGAMRSAQ